MAMTNAVTKWLTKNSKSKGAEKDKVLWTLIKNEYDMGLELRRPFERIWMLELAFLQSKQYVYLDKQLHKVSELLRTAGKPRTVDNILIPKFKRQVSDLIKNDPEMSVVPNTVSNEDRKAAKSGDVLLKHWWRNNGMKKKTRNLATWMFGTGNAFVDDRWNTSLGPTVNAESGDTVYLGDVDCGIYSPFEIVVPAYGLNPGELNDMPWMATGKWRTFQFMRENFDPKKVEEITAEDMPSNEVHGATLFGGIKANFTKMTEGAVLIEMKIKPCPEFPKGLHVYGANGHILYQEDFPFKEYNMEHFKALELPGAFWGSCETEHALGLQIRWNKTLNSVDEYNTVMAKGKWMSPKAAKMEVDPNDKHGEVITYNPVMGHKPEHVSLKGLPATYPLILESTSRSLDNLYSQHEVSRGTNKSDIRSGEMVAILREQDAHGNIPSHMVFEEAFEKVASRILKRVQAGYDTERMIKIQGEGSQWEVRAFKGSDLRNNWDVTVKRQSTLPDSRIAREAQIGDRFKSGLYGDPRDPEVRRQVLNMLDDAVVKNVFDGMRLDEQIARNENEEISMGAQIVINQYDNHAIHVKEHNQARKTAEYQKLKREAPQQYMKLEAAMMKHQQQHQKVLDEQRAQMIAEQAALKGGGDNK